MRAGEGGDDIPPHPLVAAEPVREDERAAVRTAAHRDVVAGDHVHPPRVGSTSRSTTPPPPAWSPVSAETAAGVDPSGPAGVARRCRLCEGIGRSGGMNDGPAG